MTYGLILIVILSTGCSLDEINAKFTGEDPFFIVAHRGASAYAPDNTLASYELAEEMKADYIELDIHLTKDHEIVVMHDHDVSKTTVESGEISDFTLKELKALSANTHEKKAKKMNNEPTEKIRVPSLREVFDDLGTEVNYMIELKAPEKNKGIEEKLVALLMEYAFTSSENKDEPQVIVHSFHEKALKRLHTLNQEIPLLQLVTFEEEETPVISDEEVENLRTYSTAIGVSHRYLDEAFIEKMEAANLPVYATAVQEAKVAEEMKEIGARGIFTDKPDLVE